MTENNTSNGYQGFDKHNNTLFPGLSVFLWHKHVWKACY